MLISQANSVLLEARVRETTSSQGLGELTIQWGYYIDRVIDAETAFILQVRRQDCQQHKKCACCCCHGAMGTVCC